jgi:hypothetical protein
MNQHVTFLGAYGYDHMTAAPTAAEPTAAARDLVLLLARLAQVQQDVLQVELPQKRLKWSCKIAAVVPSTSRSV